jgi:glycosyltransferase involved in cell wall biosynthesis
LRILAVAPYYDPEGGGLERYAHCVLRRLAHRGHDVTALTFSTLGEERFAYQGVDVERVAPMLRLGNTPIHPRFRRRVQSAIAASRPDVIVAHTPVPFPAEMAFNAARREGVPFVVTYHAGRLRGSSLGLSALATLDRLTLERRMLAGARRLIAVTPYVRDHALAGHAERTDIVVPGVDHHRFTPYGTTEWRKRRDILFVGPLDRRYKWKGVDVLTRAFHQVRAEFPDARLTLVGDGDRREEFERHARRQGTNLRVLGRLSDEDLIDEYRRAAVTVLPSTTDAESFGMVLAEANACACPVIGSAIGGIPHFVRDGDNGLLARPGDANDLAGKILQVLRDPDAAHEMGRRGRARVEREHDWDVQARLTEQVLERAAAHSRGGTRPLGRATSTVSTA